jgi:hypothetical protein
MREIALGTLINLLYISRETTNNKKFLKNALKYRCLKNLLL